MVIAGNESVKNNFVAAGKFIVYKTLPKFVQWARLIWETLWCICLKALTETLHMPTLSF